MSNLLADAELDRLLANEEPPKRDMLVTHRGGNTDHKLGLEFIDARSVFAEHVDFAKDLIKHLPGAALEMKSFAEVDEPWIEIYDNTGSIFRALCQMTTGDGGDDGY